MFKYFTIFSTKKEEVIYSEYKNALEAGNKIVALYLIERVIDLNPNDKGARYQKGKLLDEMNRSLSSST